MNNLKGNTLLMMVFLSAMDLGGSLLSNDAVAAVRPVFTENVDEPGRVPYQSFLQATRGAGSACGVNYCNFSLPVVPANKRLVITNISFTISLEAAAVVQNLRLAVLDSSFNTLSQFMVPFNPNAYPADSISSGNPRRYVGNEQLKLYVEAGQTPSISFHTTGGALNTGWPNQFLVTGYLVDLTM